MSIKVSVIIPIYNAEKYLKQCLDSVLNQTLKNIEVICVDDGSTDKTMMILNHYKKRDDRVIVLTQENEGAGAARNKGMDIAKGQYLVFLDADDYFDKDLLKLQYKKCNEFSADMCICNADIFDEKEQKYIKSDHYLQKDLIKRQLFNRKDIKDRIFQITNPAPWNKMFSSQFIKDNKIRFQHLPRANDVYFTMISLAMAERIVSVNKELVHYRVGANTDSHKLNNDKQPLAFIEALLAVKETLHSYNLYNYLAKSFSNSALDHFAYQLNKFKRDDDIYEVILKALVDNYYYEFDIDSLSNENVFSKFNYTLVNLHFNNYNRDKLISFAEDGRYLNTELISIIVPVYNTEKYLQECLDSLIKQTYKNIEIICVDDGSTDGSKVILDKYSQMDSRVHIVTQNNGGAAKARNVGTSIANGKYLLYVDSDDMLEINAIEMLYSISYINNLDVLCFDYKNIFDDDYISNRVLNNNKRRSFSQIYDGVSFVKTLKTEQLYITSPCLMLLKRSFLETNGIGFYESIIHEDELFAFHVFMNSKRISHINQQFYLRRHRNGSVMNTPISYMNVVGYFKCMVEMMKFGLVNDCDQEKKQEIVRSYKSMQFAAKDRYSKLSKKEQDNISFADPIEQALFNQTIKKEYKRDRNIKELNKSLRKMKKSKSYIIGKKITYIPRLFKRIYHVHEREGLWGIYNRIGKKIFKLHVERNYDFYKTLPISKYKSELKKWYRKRVGEKLYLRNPKTYNEKIQWLKLYDSTEKKSLLADKYLVREWVADKIGEEYLVPLLGVWDAFDEIDFEKLPNQFVLKATHGSGWNIIVKDKESFDIKKAKEKMDSWLEKNFAFYGFELHYMNITPKIIAEKYIENIDQLYDYKFMCFDGHVEFIWVDSDRFTNHRRTLFTREWQKMDVQLKCPPSEKTIVKPNNLDNMISFAEDLSKGFAHARVDFYEVDNKLYFGEITFTSSSGTERAIPREFELYMGNLIKLPKKKKFTRKSGY